MIITIILVEQNKNSTYKKKKRTDFIYVNVKRRTEHSIVLHEPVWLSDLNAVHGVVFCYE